MAGAANPAVRPKATVSPKVTVRQCDREVNFIGRSRKNVKSADKSIGTVRLDTF
jgi:hypothetical protein